MFDIMVAFANSDWRGIISYANEKLEQEHLQKYGCNTRCPNCLRWDHQIFVEGVSKRIVRSDGTDYISSKCGECGFTAYWDYGLAPVPVKCDEQGNPISD